MIQLHYRVHKGYTNTKHVVCYIREENLLRYYKNTDDRRVRSYFLQHAVFTDRHRPHRSQTICSPRAPLRTPPSGEGLLSARGGRWHSPSDETARHTVPHDWQPQHPIVALAL